MGSYDVERLEALLISLRDQVDALGDRVDALKSAYTAQLNRVEAMVLSQAMAAQAVRANGSPTRLLAAGSADHTPPSD